MTDRLLKTDLCLKIEICPYEPRTSLCDVVERDSALADDLLDCTGSGDAEPACKYVLDTWEPIFWTWDSKAREHRLALPSEIQATCEAIYFEHEPGEFADMAKASLYLIWDAANGFRDDLEREDDQ